ncbi:MAG: hypothetical protein WAM28_02385 [Chlamydiales bacterium]
MEIEKRKSYSKIIPREASLNLSLRKAFFFLFLFLLVAVALFPIQIILKSIQWKITHYCQKELGAFLDFEEIFWEGKKIVIKGGNLEKPNGFHVTFQQLVFEPTFNWSKREIGGELRIEALKIAYGNLVAEKFSLPSLPFCTFNPVTTIDRGELFLYNPSDISHFSQHVCFDFHAYPFESKILGKVEWAFPFDCTTHFCKEDDKSLNFNFQFHSPVFLNLLGSLFQERLPSMVSEWRFLEGALNGNLAIHFFDAQPTAVKGDLSAAEIKGENPHLKLLGELDHFQANIDIDFNSLASMNGEIEIRGVFMGVEAELVLDWQPSHKLMHLNFDGPSAKIYRFFPEWMQTAFEEGFSNDQLILESTLKKSDQGLEVAGRLQIADLSERYDLEFGCLFGEGEIPLSNHGYPFLDRLKSQLCLSQKPFGWVRAKQVPIEKFLSPFLLQNVQIDASGKANFEGTFDGRYAVIYYEEESFRLESPSFCLSVDHPHDGIAVHYVDLETGDHEGFLSLKGARYWQKKQDVVFKEGNALVHFDNTKIHIQDIETSWDSLCFSGEIEIDIRARDDVDLFLKAHHISGSAHDAQVLLSHFTPSFFWELSIEGEVRGAFNALDFHYHFTPYAQLIKGEIVGEIQCSFQNPFFALEAYQADLHYDYIQNQLSLQSGEGTVFIPLQKKHYTLKSGPIIFTEFPFFQTKFSMEIYDEMDCLYALEGKSQNQGGSRHIFLKGENIELNAVQQNQELVLSHFTFGKWKGEGRLDWTTDPLLIRQFYCTDGNQTEVELAAQYQSQNHLLVGDLQRIHLTSPWLTSGDILGSATFEWDMNRDHLQAWGKGSTRELTIKGIRFSDSENLTCFYTTDRGFTVEGLEVELSSDEKLKPGRIHYNSENRTVLLEPFDFSLCPSSLPWPFFPYELPPTVLAWVHQQKEPIEGQLSLEVSANNLWIVLKLRDGEYHFLDRRVGLKNFLLTYDPSECNIWSQCLHNNIPCWFHFVTDSTTLTQGKIAISERELSQEHQEGNDSLIAYWLREPGKRWSLDQLKGTFCGFNASLKAKDLMTLEGEIGLYPEKGLGLFFDPLKSYALSGSYTLDGEFTLNEEALSKVTFSGIFSGCDISIGEVKLSTFSTELFYQPGSFHFSNLIVKDWAGQLTIDRGELYLLDNDWKIEVDQLHVDKVRLSRLRSPWTQFTTRDKPFLRSFFIRSLVLDQLCGTWGDLESFVGIGKLVFGNLPKKTLLSNLLFLPTEITARIGLDLSALFPSWGTVVYDIREGKINFIDFEEMYSDGKHSQFYLVKETPAFVDFKGNVNMQVRMKQYNILMKLAELFTVTVEGTLLHPTYTFSNKFEENDIVTR